MSGTLRLLGCCRVSTGKQALEGYSLPDQRRDLQAHAGRTGEPLIEIVEDAGVSGRILHRPAVQRILALADARAFDVLVFPKVDRVGRENRIIQAIIYEVRQRGLSVRFLDGGTTDTKSGRLLVNTLGAVAEYEWDDLREKTMGGRVGKAETGRFPGGSGRSHGPYGYRVITRAEAQVLPEFAKRDGELLVIEAEAVLVRELFLRFVAGETPRALAGDLNHRGLRTRQGRPWDPTTLSYLLHQEVYAGTHWYGRASVALYEVPDGTGRKRQRRAPRPREDWQAVPAPAIVDRALWERAQARLAATHDRFRGRPTLVYLLRGCVFCATCRRADHRPYACSGKRGSNTPTRPAHANRYYYCNGGCRARARANELEALAWEALKDRLEAGDLPQLAWERASADREAALRELGDRDRLARDLAALDAEEALLLRQAVAGGFAPHVVQGVLTPLHARRAALAAQAAGLEAALAALADPAAVARRAAQEQVEATARLEEAERNPEVRQDLLRRFVRVFLTAGQPPFVEVLAGR